MREKLCALKIPPKTRTRVHVHHCGSEQVKEHSRFEPRDTVLLAARRGRPFGCFGYRSCGKGIFFRFCRWPGRGAAGWENFAARRVADTPVCQHCWWPKLVHLADGTVLAELPKVDNGRENHGNQRD